VGSETANVVLCYNMGNKKETMCHHCPPIGLIAFAMIKNFLGLVTIMR